MTLTVKPILLLFDSLNRHYLPPYGNELVHAPNFSRLAQHSATFEKAYVCSMPCMPARRDILTGRPNFLHRAWGPIEPWDDCFTERLKEAGVGCHLLTDHYHYFEDGGATYHNRYSTWQCFRGQEGDPWIAQSEDPEIPPNINGKGRHQDWVNRQFMRTESDWPQVQTFDATMDFLDRNAGADRWFLQIETFDPHEPFTSPEEYQKLYPSAGTTPIFDWPGYQDVTESDEEVQRARHNYAALLSLCGAQLGRLLDAMDRHKLWDDTLLIVATDHGYLLGENGRWAKNIPHMWEEISHTPFFVHDPRAPEADGSRRNALVQPACDIAPTVLSFFELPQSPHITGKNLDPVVEGDIPQHEAVMFGQHDVSLHITDGRYVYHRQVTKPEVKWHSYTWMPTRLRGFWTKDALNAMDGAELLPFSNGIAVPRFLNPSRPSSCAAPHRLYDLESDPEQNATITDLEVEARMATLLLNEMLRTNVPQACIERYGLNKPIR